MKIIPILLICASTNAAMAQDLLSADEFDQFSVGTTLYFSQDGIHYGAEQFFQDRRTVWRAADGTCINGKWTNVAEGICFVYQDQSDPHCWTLIREDGIITISSMFDSEDKEKTVLEVSGQNTVPISCEGPIFGA